MSAILLLLVPFLFAAQALGASDAVQAAQAARDIAAAAQRIASMASGGGNTPSERSHAMASAAHNVPDERVARNTPPAPGDERHKTYDDGAQYVGQVKNGFRNGQGTMTWPDGSTYSGHWRNDWMHGQGVRTSANGDTYDGAWRSGKRHGIGVETVAGNGSQYRGQFDNDEKHGQGDQSFQDGSTYSGHWRHNHMDGQGVFTDPDGGQYDGGFVDDRKDGQGVQHFVGGDKYEGEWRDGKMHGRGVLAFREGGHYEGDFHANQMTGIGVQTEPNGDRYSGSFLNGKYEGDGLMIEFDGGRYEGKWRHSEPEGTGVYQWTDGTRYEGSFARGQRHGKGVFTYLDGSRCECDACEKEHRCQPGAPGVSWRERLSVAPPQDFDEEEEEDDDDDEETGGGPLSPRDAFDQQHGRSAPVRSLAVDAVDGSSTKVANSAEVVAEAVDDDRPEITRVRGTVGPGYCFARMRLLPRRVVEAAIAEMRPWKEAACGDLTDASRTRARGVLLVRNAVPEEARRLNLEYLAAMIANETGKTHPVKRHHGRSTFRDPLMSNPQEIYRINPLLLDTLDGLLVQWHRRGLTPPLPWVPAGALAVGRPPQVREVEHVVLNPDENHDCPWPPNEGVPCGCDWHVDGGLRGFKIWATLGKDEAAAAAGHAGIVVAPMNYAQRLCEVAGRLNASMASAGESNDQAEASGARARTWDILALEGASCVVEAVPGDLLFFYPGVFHRSQDVAAHRVAIIAEAM